MFGLGLALALALAARPAERVTLVLGGDVALGRVVGGVVVPIGGDAPLAGVADVLGAADLAIVNQEVALWDGPVARDGIRLVAPTRAARALAAAGVDVVSLANNHALDAGLDGLAATTRALGEAGVDVVGLDARGLVREVRGVRVALFAATDRVNATTPAALRRHVHWLPSRSLYNDLPARFAAWRAATPADVYVVLLHWGEEGAPAPSRAQVALAHALVDAGATVVAGHGAHVVHPVERRGASVIAYGLGNLVFDMDGEAARRGALVRVTVARGAALEVDVHTTRAGASGGARFATAP